MERTRTVLQPPFTQNCCISIGDISLEGLKREINWYGIWGNLPNFENNCIFKRLFIPSYNEKQYKHTQCLIFDIHPSTPACTYIGKTRNKMVCCISITACRILKKNQFFVNFEHVLFLDLPFYYTIFIFKRLKQNWDITIMRSHFTTDQWPLGRMHTTKRTLNTKPFFC